MNTKKGSKENCRKNPQSNRNEEYLDRLIPRQNMVRERIRKLEDKSIVIPK